VFVEFLKSVSTTYVLIGGWLKLLLLFPVKVVVFCVGAAIDGVPLPLGIDGELVELPADIDGAPPPPAD
jgi:hypothetical protein